MRADAELDIIVYGATGFTGQLVAEHFSRNYGVSSGLKWGLAGRSPEKLKRVRDEIGAPETTPLIVADAADPASLEAMVRRTKAAISTVGPYQLYGSELVSACVNAGTDYLDLSGEPTWMRETISQYADAARKSGARIVHSAGFDSIPFELGVWFAQETAKERLGGTVGRIKGRVRAIKGGLSGGTAASGKATMAAMQRDPSLLAVMMDPFALSDGFKGPAQPDGMQSEFDPDIGAEVGPFMMAVINTKNVHRSNALMGHPWGKDFIYDEMAVRSPDDPAAFATFGGDQELEPGDGPSKEERETGLFDLVFIGIASDGRKVKVGVKGDKDPGYGSTSRMIAETALCLIEDCADVPGGVWTPGAAMRGRLVDRLQARAGLTFQVEA